MVPSLFKRNKTEATPLPSVDDVVNKIETALKSNAVTLFDITKTRLYRMQYTHRSENWIKLTVDQFLDLQSRYHANIVFKDTYFDNKYATYFFMHETVEYSVEISEELIRYDRI